MESIQRHCVDQKGQSTVEYILVLVVVIAIGATVFKSNAFKQLFGDNSNLFASLRSQFEYSYRHGSPGTDATTSVYGNEQHETYYDPISGESRFFTPREEY
ncbi:hypothetical protein HBN50_15705 [Halobacteriovorax sp. GB3]|uniref:hypothetical protein n=1 Tax=Halobacteriovorax sp. GB3 TaxID=2719615 RepID=UPI00235E0132|nr:hypothetical protein [Halobacteriovorax sp. GB3]MDD0854557.1 hypothetical protein [Halobacteriovorax sp. GB3]